VVDRGEVVQEFVERIAPIDVIEERLEGNPRAYEHRHAAHDLGVAVNEGRIGSHGWILSEVFFGCGIAHILCVKYTSRISDLEFGVIAVACVEPDTWS
jgi:hypothetical protein